MATINDIVSGALKRAGVVAIGQSPSAEEAADGLDNLNDMMMAGKVAGFNVLWATVSLTDTFPLEDHHISGVKAMLALRLTDAFGGSPTQVLAGEAIDGKRALQADYALPEPMKADQALLNMPSQRRRVYSA